MRKFVAGVQALEMRRAIDVVACIDQPVRVKHDNGVHAQFATATTYLNVAFNGILAGALAWSVKLAQVH